MTRKIIATLCGLLLGALLVATPAHASFSWCTGSAIVCFAEHTDGNGLRWSSQLLPVGACIGVPSNLNDKISSLWNKYTSSGGQVTGYINNPCSGSGWMYTWGPGAFVPNIGWANNDKMSAVCLGPRGPGHCP